MAFPPVKTATSAAQFAMPNGLAMLEQDLSWPGAPGPINTMVVLATVCIQGISGLSQTDNTAVLVDDGGGSYGAPIFWVDSEYEGGPAIGMWIGTPPTGTATLKFTFNSNDNNVLFHGHCTVTLIAAAYNFPTFPSVQDFGLSVSYTPGARTMSIVDSQGATVTAEIEWDSSDSAYSDQGWALLDLLVDGAGSDFLIVAGAGSPSWMPPAPQPPTAGARNYARLISPTPSDYVTGFGGAFSRAMQLEEYNVPGTPGPFCDASSLWDQAYRIPSSGPLTLACPDSAAPLGVPYSSAFVPSGGVTPYAGFSIPTGELPTGLTLDTLTGDVTGTPSARGVFPYTGEVVDAYGQIATTDCSMEADTLDVACHYAQIGVPFVDQLQPSGGVAPFAFVLTGGALPDGLTLDGTTGKISGTPTVLGPFSFSFQVTDSFGLTASATCSILVGSGPPPVSGDLCIYAGAVGH